MNSTPDFIRWMWKYARPYFHWIVVATVGIILFTLTNAAAVIYVFHKLLSQIESGTLGEGLTVNLPEVPLLLPEGYEWVVASGSEYEILNTLMIYAAVIVFVRVVSDFIRLFVMDYVSIAIAKDIRADLYENILKRPVTFFERRNVGDLMSRLSNDISQVKQSLSVGLRDLFMAPLELFVAVGLVMYFAPYLAIFFLIIPICGYAIYHVGNRIRRYSRATQDVMGDLHSRMQERFAGIKLVKSAGYEATEIEEFNDQNEKHFRKRRRKIASDSILRPALHSFVLFPALGVLYLALSFVIQDYLTISALGTFLISLPYVYKSLRKLSGLNDTIQSSRGAAERIENIFSESRVYNVDLPEGNKEPTFDENIVFDDVGYHYPGYEEMALREINMTLTRGENLALVGPSGVGKSTYTDLLMRFIDPSSGEIRMDERELTEYNLTQYRRLFGLVTQEPILFDATISENISYGRDQVSQSDVIRAAQQAEAKKFIDDLPGGFETHVGEKGVKLSGGEKQRIALARALAGDPQILVLDEATSNIDSRSEKMIIDAIEKLPTEMTLLTISHALATVQFADQIMVLNDHTIEAIGDHSSLLEESPTYRELYEHQVDDLETAFG